MIELKPDLPEILEVEYSAYPRKWSTGFTNMEDASLFSQQNESPEDMEPTQDIFGNPRMKMLNTPCHKFMRMTILKKNPLLSTK
jgi:hypothetical protein